MPIWVPIFLQRQTNQLQQDAPVKGIVLDRIIEAGRQECKKILVCNLSLGFDNLLSSGKRIARQL